MLKRLLLIVSGLIVSMITLPPHGTASTKLQRICTRIPGSYVTVRNGPGTNYTPGLIMNGSGGMNVDNFLRQSGFSILDGEQVSVFSSARGTDGQTWKKVGTNQWVAWVRGDFVCSSSAEKSDPLEISMTSLSHQCRLTIASVQPGKDYPITEGGSMQPRIDQDYNGDISIIFTSDFSDFSDSESNMSKRIGINCPEVKTVYFSGPTGASSRWYMRRTNFTETHSRDSGYPGDYCKYWGHFKHFDYDPNEKCNI